jgi:integrase
MKSFCAREGFRFVHLLGLDVLRKFREGWADSNISAQKKLERLRSVCKFWCVSGWLPENYALAIRAPEVKDVPTLPFTREEMADLLGAIERLGGTDLTRKRIRALILLLRYSGLRIGDATRLHESKVHGSRIRLRTQKTGTHVDVPLPPFLLDRLADLPKQGGFYFVPGRGQASTSAGNYRRTFRRLAMLAGMEGAHPHQFRDTFAVELLQKGVPIEDVSVLLGHKSVKITQEHYSPWVKSRQDAMERNVERAWEGETEPSKVVKFRKAG